jgi:UDP-3-O-[3-hydroxymyristoyl] glucosamine N-acyltransferase
MPDRRFFAHAGPFTLADLAGLSGITVDPAHVGLEIARAAPLVRSDARSVSFCVDRKFEPQLKATQAAAVFVPPNMVEYVPSTCIAVVTREPQAAWSRAARKLHPLHRLSNTAAVHPTAELEDDVYLAPGAVVGQGARIGRGTSIGANTSIGPGVSIGRDCVIGPQVSILCALIGDRVHLFSSCVIGEPGFGVAGSSAGAVDVPQLGRVILQDGVTVGANTCIDRGAFDDTVIGENTKIDNLVQIGHNTVIGRNCAVAGQCGISGSVVIGDGCQFGGMVGVADHMTIGAGARIGANAGVMAHVPAGETWGGFPAGPMRQWLREMALIRRMARGEGGKK